MATRLGKIALNKAYNDFENKLKELAEKKGVELTAEQIDKMWLANSIKYGIEPVSKLDNPEAFELKRVPGERTGRNLPELREFLELYKGVKDKYDKNYSALRSPLDKALADAEARYTDDYGKFKDWAFKNYLRQHKLADSAAAADSAKLLTQKALAGARYRDELERLAKAFDALPENKRKKYNQDSNAAARLAYINENIDRDKFNVDGLDKLVSGDDGVDKGFAWFIPNIKDYRDKAEAEFFAPYKQALSAAETDYNNANKPWAMYDEEIEGNKRLKDVILDKVRREHPGWKDKSVDSLVNRLYKEQAVEPILPDTPRPERQDYINDVYERFPNLAGLDPKYTSQRMLADVGDVFEERGYDRPTSVEILDFLKEAQDMKKPDWLKKVEDELSKYSGRESKGRSAGKDDWEPKVMYGFDSIGEHLDQADSPAQKDRLANLAKEALIKLQGKAGAGANIGLRLVTDHPSGYPTIRLFNTNVADGKAKDPRKKYAFGDRIGELLFSEDSVLNGGDVKGADVIDTDSLDKQHKSALNDAGTADAVARGLLDSHKDMHSSNSRPKVKTEYNTDNFNPTIHVAHLPKTEAEVYELLKNNPKIYEQIGNLLARGTDSKGGVSAARPLYSKWADKDEFKLFSDLLGSTISELRNKNVDMPNVVRLAKKFNGWFDKKEHRLRRNKPYDPIPAEEQVPWDDERLFGRKQDLPSIEKANKSNKTAKTRAENNKNVHVSQAGVGATRKIDGKHTSSASNTVNRKFLVTPGNEAKEPKYAGNPEAFTKMPDGTVVPGRVEGGELFYKMPELNPKHRERQVQDLSKKIQGNPGEGSKHARFDKEKNKWYYTVKGKRAYLEGNDFTPVAQELSKNEGVKNIKAEKKSLDSYAKKSVYNPTKGKELTKGLDRFIKQNNNRRDSVDWMPEELKEEHKQKNVEDIAKVLAGLDINTRKLLEDVSGFNYEN